MEFFEKIVLAVISGILVPICLEWWKERKAKRQAIAGEQASQVTAPVPTQRPSQRETSFRLFPILISLIAAFFGSAFIAGILEANGHSEIKFGSALANALMFGTGLATWLLVGRRK